MIFLANKKGGSMPGSKGGLMTAPKEDTVEIKELFSQFRGQLEELLNKKKDLETKLQDIKKSLATNQEEEFQKLHELEELIGNGVKMNNSRLKFEKELDEINDRIVKLTKIHSELSEVWK